jgi:hypothetical protein
MTIVVDLVSKSDETLRPASGLDGGRCEHFIAFHYRHKFHKAEELTAE